MPGLAESHFTGDAALQLVHDPYGAGRSTVALEVDGIDRVLSDLEHHDIIPETIIEGTAKITDAVGNRIRSAAHLPQSEYTWTTQLSANALPDSSYSDSVNNGDCVN